MTTSGYCLGNTDELLLSKSFGMLHTKIGESSSDHAKDIRKVQHSQFFSLLHLGAFQHFSYLGSYAVACKHF